MPRLFVAIRPPPETRQRLLAAMGGITGARWQSDEQLHLTLRFIGEADRHLARDIHAALGAVRHPRFDLSVNGLGTFERRGRPEVVWAAVGPVEPLRALHNKIDQALARVGVEPDRRTFHAHITLARLARSAGSLHNFLDEAGGLTTPSFAVSAFVLYESRLTPEGALYSQIDAYPLG